MTSGIYQITIHGKRYVGSSKNVEKRIHNHLAWLEQGKHNNLYMQRMFDKYGEFEIQTCILKKCTRLLYWEQKFIDNLNSDDLNESRIAGKVEFTEDVRSKMSMSQNKFNQTARAKEVHSAASERMKENNIWLGKHHSEESKEKIGRPRRGKTLPDWWKTKIGKGLLGNHNKLGKPNTEKQKQAVAESNKKRKSK